MGLWNKQKLKIIILVFVLNLWKKKFINYVCKKGFFLNYSASNNASLELYERKIESITLLKIKGFYYILYYTNTFFFYLIFCCINFNFNFSNPM